MKVDWVQLTGFRSYDNLNWSPAPGVNILVGPNGAGKTNVLEAITFMATLRSFRGVAETDLINDDVDDSILRAGLSDGERERLIEIQLRRSGPRRVQVDKKGIRRLADLLDVARVVKFLPDDLDLVKRSAGNRRDLIDEVAIQLWPAATLDQSEYARALRQRNAYLRAGERDDVTLSVWDKRLAQAGGRVLARREHALRAIGEALDLAYQEISGKDHKATLSYTTSWGGGLGERSAADYAAMMSSALESARKVDRDRRVTTVGPHRDDPSFSLDGVDTRSHGSQGEQRSMALAVRLASHRAIAELTSVQPILLLDDVFSELDPSRSEALAASLPEGTQTLITTARPEDVPLSGTRWKVEGGAVNEW